MPSNAELLMGRDQRIDELMAENAKLRAANAALVAALEDCCARMDEVFSTVRYDKTTTRKELDTSRARAALKLAKGE